MGGCWVWGKWGGHGRGGGEDGGRDGEAVRRGVSFFVFVLREGWIWGFSLALRMGRIGVLLFWWLWQLRSSLLCHMYGLMACILISGCRLVSEREKSARFAPRWQVMVNARRGRRSIHVEKKSKTHVSGMYTACPILINYNSVTALQRSRSAYPHPGFLATSQIRNPFPSPSYLHDCRLTQIKAGARENTVQQLLLESLLIAIHWQLE